MKWAVRAVQTVVWRTAVLAGVVTSGCNNSDRYGSECYTVGLELADWHDQACKPASAITESDLNNGGSMIFQAAESGPTRTVVRTDCCSYDVAETVCDARRGAQTCGSSSSPPENLQLCLNVTADASCPGQLDAGVPLQKQYEGVKIVTVSSPSTRQVTVKMDCCYVVRRRWDGG